MKKLLILAITIVVLSLPTDALAQSQRCRTSQPFCDNGYMCSAAGFCIPEANSLAPAINQNQQSLPQGQGTTVGCGGNIENGINTALGCIPITDPNSLIGWILKWAIGIGGGVAFLLILVAGFQITTSTGDPKKLQAGQELMTSAIGGLLLLIFSTFVLRVIGVDILGIL